MREATSRAMVSFLPLLRLLLGLFGQLNLLFLGHRLKQPSSARAVGCCGLQHGPGMQHNHCLIPEVPHTYGGEQERLQSICAPEGSPKSKMQHVGCHTLLGLDTKRLALLVPGQGWS